MSEKHATLKRAFDVTASVGLLLTTLPVTALAAASIKIETPEEPIFYSQPRFGRHGKKFLVHKFRSMSSDTSKTKEERISRVGRFLRRYGVDELPQLISVLRGDMSLVGPRPLVVKVPAPYDDRYLARPGLTGPAQTNGFRGKLPPGGTIEEAAPGLEMDAEYARNAGFGTYLEILFKTPFKLNTQYQPPVEVTSTSVLEMPLQDAANDDLVERPDQHFG